MKKTVITILLIMCSPAFGLTFMGPPMAELEQGQKSVGFNFSYSEMDVEVSGLGISETMDDVESLAYLVNLGYGITDGWETFVRLGLTDVEFDEFDGSSEFAYGFGTKVTFGQQDAVTWGGLFQITWLESDDSGTVIAYGHTFTGTQEIDAYEIQIAIGPTYDYDGISIYGGPFLHFIEGDYDWSGTVTGPVLNGSGSFSFDVEQESEIGGYVGLNADLTESANWQIEYQFTGDAYAICTGIGWKF